MEMKIISRLIEVLLQKGIEVPLYEIGVEAHMFYPEEIDEKLVPPAIIDHLEGPLATEAASYIDKDGNDYLLILVETDQPEPFEVWLSFGARQTNYSSKRRWPARN